MADFLLGLLLGLILVDTVAVALLCRRVLIHAAERAQDEQVQEAMEEEAKRSKAMDEGFENLMRYTVRNDNGFDAAGMS